MAWPSVARWWTTWLLAGAFGFMLFFIASFMLIGGVMSLLVDDVDAVMDGPWAFAVALTFVFAASGAGLGLGQWLHLRRRVRRAGRWIGLMAVAFALISITYNALVLSAGEAHLDTAAGRAANELAHTIIVGIVVAALSWRFIAAVNGLSRQRWLLLVGATFPLTGLSIWGLEVLLNATGGDVNPLGMLVAGLMLGLAWRPALRTSTPADAAMAAAMPA